MLQDDQTEKMFKNGENLNMHLMWGLEEDLNPPGFPQYTSAPTQHFPSEAHTPTASTLTKISYGAGSGIANFSTL